MQSEVEEIKPINTMIGTSWMFFKSNEEAFETPLFLAVENLMLQWTQLLSQIPVSVGMVQPTEDHVKESAEIVIRQFRDACLDASSEFARKAFEWRIRCPNKIAEEEICDLESSIKRQKYFLAKIEEQSQDIVENNSL